MPSSQAGYLAGRNAWGVALAHVLPNVAPLLVVQAAIQLAFALLAEASLSYLGLGVQPPGASWGRMLGEAQTYMRLAPHVVLFPGLAIVLAVMGLNLLGDGLRDRLDPHGRGGP